MINTKELPNEIRGITHEVQNFASRFVVMCDAGSASRFHFFGHDDLRAILAVSQSWMNMHGGSFAFTAIYDRLASAIIHYLHDDGMAINLPAIKREIESEL